MSFPRYEKYKDSGVAWLGEVPDGWSLKKVKYCLIDTEGIKIGPFGSALKLDTLSESGVKIYGQGNVIKNDFSSGERYLPLERFEKEFNQYEAKEKDVLVTMMGTTGKAKIFQKKYEKGIIDSHLLRLRLDQNKLLSELFIVLLENSPYVNHQIKLKAKGSIMEGLNSSIVKSLEIVVPPLPEQRTIATFLDHETAKIDALVSEQEKLIELLKEKRQAVIYHAVTKGLDPNAKMKDSGVEWLGEVPEGWEVVSIKFLSSVQRGASPRPIDDPKYFDDDGEYAWVRIADVTASNGLLTETTQRLSELGSSLSVKLDKGSLFLSIAGSVGKPCITGMKACIHDGFVYFPRLEIDQQWLYRIFEAGICYGGLGKMGTQLNLNTDTVGSIRVPTPSTQELNSILTFLDHETAKIDALVEEAKKAIELMKERRTALISAAVTGKIDVRTWQPPADESAFPDEVRQAGMEVIQ